MERLYVSKFTLWKKRAERQTAKHFCIIYTLRIWKILRRGAAGFLGGIHPRWHATEGTWCHHATVLALVCHHQRPLFKAQLSRKTVECFSGFNKSSWKMLRNFLLLPFPITAACVFYYGGSAPVAAVCWSLLTCGVVVWMCSRCRLVKIRPTHVDKCLQKI